MLTVRRRDPISGPAIGFALAAAVLIGGPVSGVAVNPARALGPMLVSGALIDWWAYILGPVLGGIIAALVYDRFLAHASTPDPEQMPAAGAPALDPTDGFSGPETADIGPAGTGRSPDEPDNRS